MTPRRATTARRLVRVTAQPDPADTLALIADAIAGAPAGARIEVGWAFDAVLLDPPPARERPFLPWDRFIFIPRREGAA